MRGSDAQRTLQPRPEEALAAWSALVREAREQERRLGEAPSDEDRWADVAQRFRPGGELAAPEVEVLAALAEPGDAWLDIGAGGGRFAVPLAERVARVIALEPSPAMRATLRDAAGTARVEERIEVVDGHWPEVAFALPPVDGVLAANVLYAIEDLAAFLGAMERHARHRCVAILGDRGRGEAWPELWQALYGEPARNLPGLREFLAVLGALDRRFDVHTVALSPSPPRPLEAVLPHARRLLWTRPGSERERRLASLLEEHYGERGPDGELRIALPPRRRYNALVSWRPPGSEGATGEPLPA